MMVTDADRRKGATSAMVGSGYVARHASVLLYWPAASSTLSFLILRYPASSPTVAAGNCSRRASIMLMSTDRQWPSPSDGWSLLCYEDAVAVSYWYH